MKSEARRKRQRVLNISIREDLLPWWNATVEPAIKKSGLTRSGFVMQAVREKVERDG